MNLQQLEDSLPNGFHDAEIETITVDYISRVGIMKMQLCVGNPEAAAEEEREAYRSAELHVFDLLYFVIDPPDAKYQYAEKKSLWVDAGKAGEGRAPTSRIPCEHLPNGSFAYWFFVRDWNSFIHIAAMDASLAWLNK